MGISDGILILDKMKQRHRRLIAELMEERERVAWKFTHFPIRAAQAAIANK